MTDKVRLASVGLGRWARVLARGVQRSDKVELYSCFSRREESRNALEEVVAALERGNTTLEQSLALWERGEALAKRCQTWLDGARERIAAAAEPAPDQD